MRCLPIVLSTLFALFFVPFAAAQDLTAEQFHAELAKARELNDNKLVDKVIKAGPGHALRYYEDLMMGRLRGETSVEPTADVIRESWKRVFESGETIEKLERWCELHGQQGREGIEKCRRNMLVVWRAYSDGVSKDTIKTEYQKVYEQLVQIAQSAQQLGHSLEAAEDWWLAGTVAAAMPEKNTDDKRTAVEAMKAFLEARRAWGFTGDRHFLFNQEFVKSEEEKLEAAAKVDEKRKKDGYDPNAKGVDSLLMPKAKSEVLPLKFEALAAWDTELDYGPKSGYVPAYWWIASTTKEQPSRELNWFRRARMFLVRLGVSKFGITLDPNDPKKTQEIDASAKGKVTSFWLDGDKKTPYAMFFWAGSDKEHVGEADQNMAPSDTVGNVYYRSAASWKTAFGQEPMVLYDDDANGSPGDADAMAPAFKSSMLGDHESEGTVVPLFDSMRVGKGARVPFSEFVQFPTGWFHVKKVDKIDQLAVRAFNPEYLKTGKIKLVWNHKPSAPAQLVVQGEGEYRTALFDVASGKEVEVPAATYSVIWGRIQIGKGARGQSATIYKGVSQSFTVEPGKVFELKMGAPFSIQWTRRGDQTVSIDALKILPQEASGCVMTDLQGLALWPEVLAGKTDDGKGAKLVKKFIRFTDPELVVKASNKHNSVGTMVACFPMPEDYREGELVLTVKLPAEGMKVGLSMKKHPLFGVINSPWQ